MDPKKFKTLSDLDSIGPNDWWQDLRFILEWKGDKKKCFHIVKISGAREYQQFVSIDAFCERDLREWYHKYYMKGKIKPRRFNNQREEDIYMDIESWGRLRDKFKENPKGITFDWKEEFLQNRIKHHKSVWSFYNFIGYDWKKKKYN